MSAPCHNTAWTIITVLYEVTIFLTDHTSDLTRPVDHWSQWTPILKLFPQTHTQHSSSYSTKSFILLVRPDLVTTREISAVDLPYSRRRPFESTRNWIAVRNDPPPDLVRHRVASRGGDKRGTTWDDSCGRAAIPVAISIAESWWVGAIPVAISIAESSSRR